MLETITQRDTDISEAKSWRNRWYMKDGRSCWGEGVYPSRELAAAAADWCVSQWEKLGWSQWLDTSRYDPFSQFAMVLQLPVGGAS